MASYYDEHTDSTTIDKEANAGIGIGTGTGTGTGTGIGIGTRDTNISIEHDQTTTGERSAIDTTVDGDDEDDPELAEMKRKLEEMEREARKNSAVAGDGEDGSNQEEVDGRSVYVGQVDYSASQEELKTLFSACGDVERVTILRNHITGQPKGYAYIEFKEPESIANAILLNDTSFKGRQIKVTAKRTNVPAHHRGGRGGRGRGAPPYRGRGRGGYYTGYAPVFRGRGSYRGRGRGGYAYAPY